MRSGTRRSWLHFALAKLRSGTIGLAQGGQTLNL